MWLYGADGDYLGFTLNGVEYYYVKNMQGDVVAIADENRQIVVTYLYNDYGKIESVGGSLADTVGALNPIRYRGYYYDEETGFYFLNSRYYDPQICRFINADSVIPRRQQRHQYLQVQQIHQTLNILEMIQQNVTFQISNGADLVHRHRDGEIM